MKRSKMNGETKQERLLLLKKIPLLGLLSEEALAACCVIKKYAKGETIFREEEENNCLYILLEGLVKLMVFLENGKAQILHFVTRGDFFGDVSIQIEKVSAVAQIPSDVAVIPKTQFKALLQNNDFAIQFITMMYARFNIYQGRMLLISMKRSKERFAIANPILSEVTENGKKHKLTDQEIGDFCSLTRETTGRRGKILTFKKCLTMEERRERNKKMVSEFLSGAKVKKLAKIHSLGVHQVRNIIRKAMEEEPEETSEKTSPLLKKIS